MFLSTYYVFLQNHDSKNSCSFCLLVFSFFALLSVFIISICFSFVFWLSASLIPQIVRQSLHWVGAICVKATETTTWRAVGNVFLPARKTPHNLTRRMNLRATIPATTTTKCWGNSPPSPFLPTPGWPAVPWEQWCSTFEDCTLASGAPQFPAVRRKPVLLHS